MSLFSPVGWCVSLEDVLTCRDRFINFRGALNDNLRCIQCQTFQ